MNEKMELVHFRIGEGLIDSVQSMSSDDDLTENGIVTRTQIMQKGGAQRLKPCWIHTVNQSTNTLK